MPPTGRTAADIAASIERELHTRALSPGDALPPVRTLAGELGVNANTVAAAYRTLRERGIVETHGRAGTRIRARPQTTRRHSLGPDVPLGARDLSTGEPDPALLPSPRFPDPDRWRPLYRHDALYEPFADATRTVLRGSGVPVDHLAVASGALDGIERVLAAHVRPGDTVAVEDPGWGNMLDLLGALNLTPRPVPVDEDGPDPAATEAALRAGARAFVVTARAQNPTGAAVSAERAGRLRAVLAAHPHVVTVEDDHGNDIAGVDLHTVAGVTTHWVYIRSAAKAYGPDLRCAAMVGDAVTIDRVAGRQRLGPGWVSHALQHAAAAGWTSPTAAETVRAARDAYRERRDRLIDALRDRGVHATGRSGINVWVEVPDETAAIANLLARGWAVGPGARYRVTSGPGVRITVAGLTETETADLADAVAAALRTRPRGLSR
ncbi:aminotransferase class I/II-fold pyridoxal phosphate-dependent enzyme [Streptomyces sp. SID3343]|uniref:aminotransferase class I/II-fold pyridoxal phosphate-dependent enzyme n=1 Tax=Streptomyces sp. SID3343 TaxID=2690260 RepID=UPI00136C4363|nr:aminotransferase class I/II-fold pyridoxal phosphate-dependent enzyme [Streptomyces sp. SID3343]MYW01058.1 aminotransferase class I/II-fold pyridoxal phosphate-dependent enzyme [Streptomyces sp. SID3343]